MSFFLICISEWYEKKNDNYSTLLYTKKMKDWGSLMEFSLMESLNTPESSSTKIYQIT